MHGSGYASDEAQLGWAEYRRVHAFNGFGEDKVHGHCELLSN